MKKRIFKSFRRSISLTAYLQMLVYLHMLIILIWSYQHGAYT